MLKFKSVNVFFLFAILLLSTVNFFISVSFLIYTIVVIIYLFVLSYGATVLSAQFFIPVKYKGESSSGAIAITFDDGPISNKTEKIINILDVRKIQACFFCIGNRVNDNSDLVRKIHNAGHLIGNHSYWHSNTFDLQSTNAVRTELIKTDDAIEQSIGLRPNFFRPPFGVTNPMVSKAIKSTNHQTVGWSVRSFDTISRDRDALLLRVTKSLKSGDVVLFHDYCDITIDILPDFLDFVTSKGLKIVRLDQLLNEKGYA